MLVASFRARLAQRPWWTAKYLTGKTTPEWQCDWSALPKLGLQSLRLYCPNGQIAELGSTDATWRLFQYKVGVVTHDGGRATLAYVIGHITANDGACQYAAWESEARRLVTGTDNVLNMAYHNTGMLSAEALGFDLTRIGAG